MDILERAENEINLYLNRLKDNDDLDTDYIKSCANSALKAFKSLCGDNHSGMSISFTKNILDKLINRQPLTPITEEDFYITDNDIRISPEFLAHQNLISFTQCPRYSAVFQNIDINGNVSYHDINRIICYDVDSDVPYHSSFVSQVIDEMYPIELPYMPGDTIKVYNESFLVNEKNGDFDIRGILSAVIEGETVFINRFFMR